MFAQWIRFWKAFKSNLFILLHRWIFLLKEKPYRRLYVCKCVHDRAVLCVWVHACVTGCIKFNDLWCQRLTVLPLTVWTKWEASHCVNILHHTHTHIRANTPTYKSRVPDIVIKPCNLLNQPNTHQQTYLAVKFKNCLPDMSCQHDSDDLAGKLQLQLKGV